MWPASRISFFFFVLRVRGRKRTFLHHCWSSTHLPDDASDDDFSACLKMHKDDRSNNWLYGYLRTNKQARIELVWNVILLHSLTREGRGPERVGTLRKYDGDGNGNVIKAIGLMRKTTTLHVHHAFLYISLQSLYNYDVKWPNFKFTWERERQGD